MSPEVYIFIGFAVILWTIFLFGLQYNFARLSLKIHSPCKPLARIQWRLNGWSILMSTKLKVMTYFERLSGTKKIGLTAGLTHVLTLPLYFMVTHN